MAQTLIQGASNYRYRASKSVQRLAIEHSVSFECGSHSYPQQKLPGLQSRTETSRLGGGSLQPESAQNVHQWLMLAQIKLNAQPREENHVEDFVSSDACPRHVCWIGRGQGAYGQAESPADMSNGAAGKSGMRLRSGKNGVPEGAMVPRPYECLHAVARTISEGREL